MGGVGRSVVKASGGVGGGDDGGGGGQGVMGGGGRLLFGEAEEAVESPLGVGASGPWCEWAVSAGSLGGPGAALAVRGGLGRQRWPWKALRLKALCPRPPPG